MSGSGMKESFSISGEVVDLYSLPPFLNPFVATN